MKKNGRVGRGLCRRRAAPPNTCKTGLQLRHAALRLVPRSLTRLLVVVVWPPFVSLEPLPCCRCGCWCWFGHRPLPRGLTRDRVVKKRDSVLGLVLFSWLWQTGDRSGCSIWSRTRCRRFLFVLGGHLGCCHRPQRKTCCCRLRARSRRGHGVAVEEWSRMP